MKGLLYVVLSILLTMICWGVYGPVLQQGQSIMQSGLRPFICVGLAYFGIAVVAPIVLLKTVGEKGHWSATGILWSVVAGVVTAIGSLGIILAIGARGSPVYVMPLVFGIAPVVNSFVTIHFSRAYKHIGPVFLAGLILVVAGAVTVLLSAPRPSEKVTVENSAGGMTVVVVSQTADGTKTSEYAAASPEEFQQKYPKEYRAYVPLSAKEWALSPVLHADDGRLLGRLRPNTAQRVKWRWRAAAPAVLARGDFLLLGGRHPAIPDSRRGAPITAAWNFWRRGSGAWQAERPAHPALGVIMAFNFGGSRFMSCR
jgi:hypothetical protein